MKKKFTNSLTILCIAFTFTSCYVNKFNIGKGAQSNVTVKQWNHYLIDGLVPLKTADPQQMAGGAADYTVTIQHSFVNLLISSVTFGIYTPTVTIVKK